MIRALGQHLPLATVAFLFLVGLAIVFFKRNLIKILMGVTVVESAANLFIVALSYRDGSVAPIYTLAPEGVPMALPTPQALTLTAIVIGVATTAMMLSFAMVIYRHYGTTHVGKMRKMRG